ncbi:MAG: hypothetical protein KME08_16015 [Aphanothece sp. CMT-3BRIN-NPC111]|jgi:hypothetical protein|nr:hypothetical protein [Aphanothece sp. CMT-3BRIN-NPC111]
MNKKKQVSLMVAVAIALGATATSKFPGFSEASAIGAIAFEHNNDSNRLTSISGQRKLNAQTIVASLGRVQPNDDGYKPERTAQCGKRQASGGQAGDRRIIKFPAVRGKKVVRVSYDMLRIPDKLQIISKGKAVLDTGFVSGRKTRSISFNQSPKEITVVVTGNSSNSNTLWTYTVYCPA